LRERTLGGELERVKRLSCPEAMTWEFGFALD